MDAVHLQREQETLHPAVTLDPVAAAAQELEVLFVVDPVARARDNVVDLHVAQLEALAASGTVPALLAVEVRLVGLGRRQCPDVFAPGQVGPVDDVLEEALIVPVPPLHQLHRLLAEVDARPLPVQAVGGDRRLVQGGVQILDHADPLDLDVVQRPGVPELGTSRLRANGRPCTAPGGYASDVFRSLAL